MHYRTPVALIAFALLAAPAPADVLHMTNGRDIAAVDVQDPGDGTLQVLTLQGPRTFNLVDIKEREPSRDLVADFTLFVDTFRKKRDAGALFRIARWMESEGRPVERRKALEEVVAISPDHAGARDALGQAKKDGRWVDRADAGLPEDERRRGELAARYRTLLGVEPEVALSPHFEAADFLGDASAASRLRDLETAWAEAERVFGAGSWKDRCLVVSCKGEEQYLAWAKGEGAKLKGMTPAFLEFVLKATGIKWHEPKVLARWNGPSVHAMHAANVHAVGHLLVNLWKTHNRKAPFWIEEGFGGWMEDRVLSRNSSYCFDIPTSRAYGDTAKDARDWDVGEPDFKALSKKAAAAGTFLPLASLDALPRGQYSRREVGQSFSLVAFLVDAEGAAKFRDYVSRVKSGTASPKAFEEVYGRNFDAIEPAWNRFVQDRW